MVDLDECNHCGITFPMNESMHVYVFESIRAYNNIVILTYGGQTPLDNYQNS